jgi:uncharacterized protein
MTFQKIRIALFIAANFALLTSPNAQTTPVAPSASTATSTAATAAPASDAKRALAARMIVLQRGPEMERMAYQLTTNAVQPVIERWAPKLEAMPAAKQTKAREQLNTELKALGESTRKLIEAQMAKSADSALLQAYLDRFSEDELKEVVALFESPVFKKYQGMAPELGNLWIKDVVEKSRDAVIAKDKDFDAKAAVIMGVEAPKAAPKKK